MKSRRGNRLRMSSDARGGCLVVEHGPIVVTAAVLLAGLCRTVLAAFKKA
jgi:hypothetical protein